MLPLILFVICNFYCEICIWSFETHFYVLKSAIFENTSNSAERPKYGQNVIAERVTTLSIGNVWFLLWNFRTKFRKILSIKELAIFCKNTKSTKIVNLANCSLLKHSHFNLGVRPFHSSQELKSVWSLVCRFIKNGSCVTPKSLFLFHNNW